MNTEPCKIKSGVKHLAPFRCEKIPEDVIMYYCTVKYPKLARVVLWELFVHWMIRSERAHRDQRKRLSREHRNHPLIKQFTDLIQRELNYEYTTYRAGHILSRFGRVYRRRMNMKWQRPHLYAPYVFLENGNVVFDAGRIKSIRSSPNT